jgi:hypothetical protein
MRGELMGSTRCGASSCPRGMSGLIKSVPKKPGICQRLGYRYGYALRLLRREASLIQLSGERERVERNARRMTAFKQRLGESRCKTLRLRSGKSGSFDLAGEFEGIDRHKRFKRR